MFNGTVELIKYNIMIYKEDLIKLIIHLLFHTLLQEFKLLQVVLITSELEPQIFMAGENGLLQLI